VSLVTAVNDFSAVAWRSTDSVYLMSLEVVSLLKAFQNGKWSEYLLCKCKGCRKIGICSHILLVTHEMMKELPKREQKANCNLNHMLGGIAGASTKRGPPRRVKNCLQKESSSDDSDDGEDAELQW
jgi:hypothetical protein